MFGKSFRYATVFSVDQPSILPVPRAAVQKQHRAGVCSGVRWRRAGSWTLRGSVSANASCDPFSPSHDKTVSGARARPSASDAFFRLLPSFQMPPQQFAKSLVQSQKSCSPRQEAQFLTFTLTPAARSNVDQLLV
jgi:hypothetical protein